MEIAEIKVEDIITERIKNAFLKKINGLKKGMRIAIGGHGAPGTPEADADFLGIALAFQYYFLQKGVDADIFGHVGLHSHPQNTAMVTRLQIDLKDRDFFKENKKSYGRIIFCDTNISNAYLQDIHPDIVIDHHKENSIVKDCLTIRVTIGAASTIGYLLLEKLKMKFTTRIATALAIGISADTEDLTKYETTEIDIQAHKKLLQEGHYPLFALINTRYKLSRKLIELVGEAYHKINFGTRETILGIGEVKPGREHYYAFIADLVFRTSETQLVVVIGIEEGKAIIVVARISSDLIPIDDFFKIIFETKSTTDTGEKISAGSKPGAGGARIPLSKHSRGIWAIANKEERRVLFRKIVDDYRDKIKEELDLEDEVNEIHLKKSDLS